MAVAKVSFNGSTLIDLTSDTVTADKLVSGYRAHNSNGEIISGTLSAGGSQNNGSLIVSELSSNITSVIAEYGSNSQGAYISSDSVAYTTIPYNYTGLVTLNGYVGSELITSNSVTISNIDKYLCPLYIDGLLFDSEGWHGYELGLWRGSDEIHVTDSGNKIKFEVYGKRQHAGDYYSVHTSPGISSRGFKKIKLNITVNVTSGDYFRVSTKSNGTEDNYTAYIPGSETNTDHIIEIYHQSSDLTFYIYIISNDGYGKLEINEISFL